MEDYHRPLAVYEDAWDRIIERDLGVKDKDKETFSDLMFDCWKEVTNRLQEQDNKSVKSAMVLWDIVQREKALAIKERDERRRIAWEKRQERYRLEGRVPFKAKATGQRKDRFV